MKYFTFFLVFFSVAFLSVATMAQTDFWEKIDDSFTYCDVLACNENGTIFTEIFNRGVYRSTDNGVSWTENNSGLDFSGWMGNFAFNAIGSIFCGGDGGVFRSTDNGANWAKIFNQKILSIAINDSGHIFAGTWNEMGPGVILRSTDDGASWINTGLVSYTYTIAINKLGTIFAGGWSSNLSTSVVFRSTDNGVSWTNTNFFEILNPVGGIAISPDGHIFVRMSLFYGNPYNGDGIFRSTDNGEHWIPSNTGISTRPSCLAINENGCLFAGTYGGGVYRSTDDGANWTTVNTGLTNDTVTSIAINPSGTIFAATTGGLFRSVQSTTSVRELSADSPISFSLNQNYPNPFNPTTTIGYVLQEKSSTKLTLMNAIGEEIAVLVNEVQDKGYHKAELDGKNLSSGIYFYKLQAGNFVETKKMILLK